MSPFQLVLSHLKSVHTGGAGFTAQCPAHEDASPSLSIAEGEEALSQATGAAARAARGGRS